MQRIMTHLDLSPEAFDLTRDPLQELAVPLRRREQMSEASSTTPSDGTIQPGWFSQGLKGCSKRPKDDPNRKSKRKTK